MAKYIYSPQGLVNVSTGDVEPFNRDAPPALPMIMRGDDQEPLVSMADGKTYTSKALMRESYKAKNNPKGVDYDEVGTDTSYLNHVHKPLKAPKEEIVASIEKAEAAIARGEFDHVA